ncbi:MAG TPA: FAD-dependent oxidoreductase [Panacibacter sp.]|nr:FAD-dependent oxidoreductase [Panacibacter sp.]
MQVDYIIVGQGICGTFLSWNLIKEGRTVLVIDSANPYTASKVASGVINPVTGRRIVRTWMIEELLSFAWNAYSQLGNELNAPLIRQCNVLDFHSTPQMKDAFVQRLAEENEYLNVPENAGEWQQYFRYNYGIGEVTGCLLADLETMLQEWRKKLQQQNSLLEESLDFNELIIHHSPFTVHKDAFPVHYKNIVAQKIIFCDGVAGFDNKYFKMLPYVRTKGEAIIASVPGLPRTNIFKQGITIVPWKDDFFWIGSNYIWEYSDAGPTALFRKKVEEQLNYWLKIPYTIVDHIASERPANIERRPFVGLHPLHNAVGVLNGMGTKGCSLAPYFAHQLAQHLVHDKPIDRLADVKRFTRVLSM